LQPLEIQSSIFIIDDDSSIRKSLAMLLESVGYQVVCFESAMEFLKSNTKRLKDSCILLDVKMPGLDGLELQKELSTINSSTPIIFITGHGDIPMSVQAMKEGAVNFLAKPFDDDMLLQSIEEALSLSRESFDRQFNLDQTKQKMDKLSPRENEVLKYLIAGWLNKQIAFELHISERTVKAHRKKILDKMEIKSMAELVRLTEQVGIEPIK
jgi:two-component system response regulator FixJ